MMDQHQAARLLEFESEYWNDSSFPYDFADNMSMVKPTIPSFMIFNSHSLTIVIVYCICFVIAAVGNLTVFLTLSRPRHRKSRISLMIFHLSIADLLVAFFTIPIEIGWRVTVQWVAGNPACKVFLFLRAFGLYLSNNILICVSLDRYFAVLHPLSVKDARQRGRYMLTGAWVCSIVYAIPQSIVFHVEKHPQYTNFTQCVTFGSFPSPIIEYTYNVFCIVTMYFIPLVIICWVYCKILCEISMKSRESKLVITKSSSNGTLESSGSAQGSRMRLRRSDMSSIERARSRTLKMTIKIVVAFIFCWTPYITMNLWYVIDKKSAEKVNELIQASLFIMAVGNSCVNPLVYGSYAIEFKKECCRCFLPWTSRKAKADVTLIQRSLGGSKFQTPETIKSPGVSKQIVHSVRQAVHGLFKVGSGQTKSTAVCGKVLAPVSPRLSVSTTSRGPVEKMPLRTIKPIFKDTMPKSPCSEPIIGDSLSVPIIQQAAALGSPLDFSAVEPQTA